MAQRPSMRDRVKQDAAKAVNEGASYLKLEKKASFFEPTDKHEAELDFLPFENTNPKHPLGYEEGALIPYIRFKVHGNIGADEKAKYVCPTSFGKKCPVCDWRMEAARKKDVDAELVKSFVPKERILFQLNDLKDEKAGIKLWDISWHLFGKQLLDNINKAENQVSGRKRSLPHGGFAELEGGQTLFCAFNAKSFMGKEFFEISRIDAEDRVDYPEDILDDVYNLDEILKVLSYEELKAIFLEVDVDSVNEEHGKEEPPSRERSSRRSSREEEPAKEETSSRHRGRGNPEPEKKEEPAKEESTRSSRRGRNVDPEPEPEKEPVKETSSRRSRGESKKEEENRCYAGGVFGKDLDTHSGGDKDKPYGHKDHEPNCYDCPIWDDCNKEKQGLEK